MGRRTHGVCAESAHGPCLCELRSSWPYVVFIYLDLGIVSVHSFRPCSCFHALYVHQLVRHYMNPSILCAVSGSCPSSFHKTPGTVSLGFGPVIYIHRAIQHPIHGVLYL